jgi:N-methylhydantoinase B
MREEIEKIPNGVYPHETLVDGWERPIRLCVEVTVRGDEVHIDFAGTDPVVNTGINVPLCYTRAMSIHAIRLVTVPEIPPNEGTTKPMSISAPENCILNALPPAATGGRHIVGHFPTPMIFHALAPVIPDRIQADSGMLNSVSFQGRDAAGRELGAMYFTSGGYGAMAGMDGISTLPSPANMRVTPTEVWENLTGIQVESRRLLPDSGGAGEFRGGLGQEIVLRNTTGHPIRLSFFGRQTDFPPSGMMGGRPGSPLQYLIDGKLVPATGRADLPAGSRLTIRKPGGGGYGDPAKRERAQLLEDVQDGFVTAEGASRDYRVDVGQAR